MDGKFSTIGKKRSKKVWEDMTEKRKKCVMKWKHGIKSRKT